MQTPQIERILQNARETITLLVDRPETLQIDVCVVDATHITLRVQANHSDTGKLIGLQGRTARSLRMIFLAMSSQIGLRLGLDITEAPKGISQ